MREQYRFLSDGLSYLRMPPPASSQVTRTPAPPKAMPSKRAVYPYSLCWKRQSVIPRRYPMLLCPFLSDIPPHLQAASVLLISTVKAISSRHHPARSYILCSPLKAWSSSIISGWQNHQRVVIFKHFLKPLLQNASSS